MFQAFFSSKDKSKKSKCHLLQFFFGALRGKFLFLSDILVFNANSECLYQMMHFAMTLFWDTRLKQLYLSILIFIFWKSPFIVYGSLGEYFHFNCICILQRNSCKQTAQAFFRFCILQHLKQVCTDCIIMFPKWVYGLKRIQHTPQV